MPESRCQAAPELTGPSAMQGRHSPAPNAAILGLERGLCGIVVEDFYSSQREKMRLGDAMTDPKAGQVNKYLLPLPSIIDIIESIFLPPQRQNTRRANAIAVSISSQGNPSDHKRLRQSYPP